MEGRKAPSPYNNCYYAKTRRRKKNEREKTEPVREIYHTVTQFTQINNTHTNRYALTEDAKSTKQQKI